MNILRIGRNVTIIAFLFSLLFHVSSILYIFSQKTRNFMLSNAQKNELLEQNPLLPQQQQEKKNNPWVETRARAGNFGAPVFFEDLPDFAKTSTDTSEQALNEETSGLIKPDFAETTAEEPEQIKSEADSAPTETSPKEEKQDAPIETPMQQPTTVAPQKTTKISNVTSRARPELVEGYPRALEDILQQVQDEREENQLRDTNPQISSKKKIKSTPPSLASTSSNAFSRAPAKENAQKPPITLAQLTQGFLHHRKEQSGSYGISMLGIKRGIPSEEQMRYERYLQKLVWCLQNSFNINRYKQPAISSDAPVHVFFSLDRDGILQHLSIKKSSGNMYIDQFVLFIFQDASSSFPPVPSYLTDNPFSMTCVVS